MVDVHWFGLTGGMRHALAQTVAAEQLEGWLPESRQIADLVGLLTERTTYGEYLATAAGRHVRPATRRFRAPVLARRRPYLIPGTNVLRNNFGVRDHATLAELEFVATAGRILQVHSRTVHGLGVERDLDVRQLHQHVFADVYPWAGRDRIVDIRRGDSVFGSCSEIDDGLAKLADDIGDLVQSTDVDEGALSFRLARIYADYNQIHPFREGNGRAGTLLLHVVADRCGYRLSLDRVGRAEWIRASRDSMPFRRDGRADPRAFVPIMRRCLVRPAARG